MCDVFLSHSSEDAELAELLDNQIKKACGETFDVFRSTDPYEISVGDTWFPTILAHLETAKALIVLMTTSSTNSRWVGFEIGYFWKRAKRDKLLRIYPVYAPGAPIFVENLQAKALGDVEQVKAFFQKLCAQFNGNADLVELEAVVQGAITHSSLFMVSEADVKTRISDYLHSEKEKVDSYQERRNPDDPELPENNIYSGKWFVYSRFDRENNLQPGTSKQYREFLKNLIDDYGLQVDQEETDRIKFKYTLLPKKYPRRY